MGNDYFNHMATEHSKSLGGGGSAALEVSNIVLHKPQKVAVTVGVVSTKKHERYLINIY